VVLGADVIHYRSRRRGRRRRNHGGLFLRKWQRNRGTVSFFFPLERTQEVSGSRHRRTGIHGRNRLELWQGPGYVEVRRVSEGDGVDLPGCDQAANDFAYLAARGERGEEQLHVFHAGSDGGLQVDGGKYRNSRYLRGGSSLGDSALEARAEQLPLGGLAAGGNDRNDAELLPEFGNGADHCGLGDFLAKRLFQVGNVGVAGFKVLINVDGELRNLTRSSQLRATPPVTISTERIHVGQDPGGYNEIGLFTWLSQEIEPHRNSIIFKPDEKIFAGLHSPVIIVTGGESDIA